MKEIEIKRLSNYLSVSTEKIKRVLAKKKKELSQIKKTEKTMEQKKQEFYFLEDDFKKLEEKIENLHNEIKRLGNEIGKSCDVSGETFHDNFDYEECGRQQSIWSEEVRKLTVIRRKSKVVAPNKTKKMVLIGKKVALIKNGELLTFHIGSYMSFTKNYISYKSPIVSLILGSKQGDTLEGLINGKKTKIEIVSID